MFHFLVSEEEAGHQQEVSDYLIWVEVEANLSTRSPLVVVEALHAYQKRG